MGHYLAIFGITRIAKLIAASAFIFAGFTRPAVTQESKPILNSVAESELNEMGKGMLRLDKHVLALALERAQKRLSDAQRRLKLNDKGWYQYKGLPVLKFHPEGMQSLPLDHEYAYGHLHYYGAARSSWSEPFEIHLEIKLDVPVLGNQTVRKLCAAELNSIRALAFPEANTTTKAKIERKAGASLFAKDFIEVAYQAKPNEEAVLADLDRQTRIDIKINPTMYALEYPLEILRKFYPAANCTGKLLSSEVKFN